MGEITEQAVREVPQEDWSCSAKGNQLMFEHGLQVLGRFHEAFSGHKNNICTK